LAFGSGEEEPYGSLGLVATRIDQIKDAVAPDIDFTPELAISSNANSDEIYTRCSVCFQSGFFRWLDINGIESAGTAAESKSAMRFLADNHIQLNLCPASNIQLSRTKNYKMHPMRALFDEGIMVTINTDDMLLFNVGLSEMFIHFYTNKVFSAEELNIIRNNGLA
jgi:hypothetical protein